MLSFTHFCIRPLIFSKGPSVFRWSGSSLYRRGAWFENVSKDRFSLKRGGASRLDRVLEWAGLEKMVARLKGLLDLRILMVRAIVV